jgi:hypothetical protein
MTMLIIIMVVIGIYIFKLGLSIKISPGSRPMGIFPSHGQSNPKARKIRPRSINVFCILNNISLKCWLNLATVPAANLSPYSRLPVCRSVS